LREFLVKPEPISRANRKNRGVHDHNNILKSSELCAIYSLSHKQSMTLKTINPQALPKATKSLSEQIGVAPTVTTEDISLEKDGNPTYYLEGNIIALTIPKK
jgi:hypothetical protein